MKKYPVLKIIPMKYNLDNMSLVGNTFFILNNIFKTFNEKSVMEKMFPFLLWDFFFKKDLPTDGKIKRVIGNCVDGFFDNFDIGVSELSDEGVKLIKRIKRISKNKNTREILKEYLKLAFYSLIITLKKSIREHINKNSFNRISIFFYLNSEKKANKIITNIVYKLKKKKYKIKFQWIISNFFFTDNEIRFEFMKIKNEK